LLHYIESSAPASIAEVLPKSYARHQSTSNVITLFIYHQGDISQEKEVPLVNK
jgi:hypothetical protein